MTPSLMHFTIPAGCRRVLAAATLALAMAGCNNFLEVSNPGAIEEPDVDDPALIGLMVNGVVGEFQPMFTRVAAYNGVLSDELRNSHTFIDNKPLDMRTFDNGNSLLNIEIYVPIQRARFMADTISDRLESLLGDSASHDLRLARTLAYAGYTYVILGESFCSAPVNVSRAYSSDELMQMGIDRFERAIAVATAARSAGGNATSADSLINLARVGAARASLDLGDMTAAATYARDVPADFEFSVYHSDNSVRENDAYWDATGGESNGAGAIWLVVDTTYMNLDDPRVPHTPDPIQVMNGDMHYVPRQGLMFSGYSPSTPGGAVFNKNTGVKFSTGLEARYIVAEAEGATPETVDFINERRKVGDPDATEITLSDDVMAELRDQRRRDFFLDGHRLGDLRRYEKLYGIDLFPTGSYPGGATGEVYGDQRCWAIPLSEITGNPNL